MFYYNEYNENFYERCSQLYKNFDEYDEKEYLTLLKLVYDILYEENIFLVVHQDIKFLLSSIIKVLNYNFWNKNYYKYPKNIKNIINLLNSITRISNQENQYFIDFFTKNVIENILKENQLITDNDIQKSKNIFNAGLENGQFNIEKIKKFFQLYNIDLSKDILDIKGVKIPNLLLNNKNNMIDISYEFLHLLFKIYAPYLYYGHIFQEGYEYKITSSDVVFDCGSNMGLFSTYCAAQGAQVYCFEPLSYIRKYLHEVKLLYPNNIHIIPYGLSDEIGSSMFYQTENPGGSNNINVLCNKSNRLYKENCQLTTLDTFVQETSIIPTFIKIDIEGAEKQALDGAKNIIMNNKPIIHLALNHSINDPYVLLPQILSFNKDYNFFKIYEGNAQSEFCAM